MEYVTNRTKRRKVRRGGATLKTRAKALLTTQEWKNQKLIKHILLNDIEKVKEYLSLGANPNALVMMPIKYDLIKNFTYPPPCYMLTSMQTLLLIHGMKDERYYLGLRDERIGDPFKDRNNRAYKEIIAKQLGFPVPPRSATAEEDITMLKLLIEKGLNINNRLPEEIFYSGSKGEWQHYNFTTYHQYDEPIYVPRLGLEVKPEPPKKPSKATVYDYFKPDDGYSCLMEAIVNDKQELVNFILEEPNFEGINYMAWNFKGNRTALSLACQITNIDLVNKLISKGADVNAEIKLDGYDFNVLDFAVLRQNLKLVEILIDAGAKLSISGAGTIVKAINNGDVNIVKKLLGLYKLNTHEDNKTKKIIQRLIDPDTGRMRNFNTVDEMKALLKGAVGKPALPTANPVSSSDTKISPLLGPQPEDNDDPQPVAKGGGMNKKFRTRKGKRLSV